MKKNKDFRKNKGFKWPTKSCWWYTYPSEKYEFVSWDDEIPTEWKVIKFMFQTTNQKWFYDNISTTNRGSNLMIAASTNQGDETNFRSDDAAKLRYSLKGNTNFQQIQSYYSIIFHSYSMQYRIKSPSL
jgi:hypothetical protein